MLLAVGTSTLILGGCAVDPGAGAGEPGLPGDSALVGDSGRPGDSGAPDADGDGASADEDCDDADPGRYPDAVEACNWIDDDCDGLLDEACHGAVRGTLELGDADSKIAIVQGDEGLGVTLRIGDVAAPAGLELAVGLNKAAADAAPCTHWSAFALAQPCRPGSVDDREWPWRITSDEGGPCNIRGVEVEGDGDGDGNPDLVVAEYELHQVGVFPGPLAGDHEFAAARHHVDLVDEAVTGIHWGGDLDGASGDELVIENLYSGFVEFGEVYTQGRTWVFPGAGGSLSADDYLARITGDLDAQIGACTKPLGDVDGDGIDDLALEDGWIFLGPLAGDLRPWDADADFELINGLDYAWIGDCPFALGDLDGNGLTELGVFYAEDRSRGWDEEMLVLDYAELPLAAAASARRSIELYLAGFTLTGAQPGDFDGDGRPDLVLGSGTDEGEPSLYLEYGPFEDGMRSAGEQGALVPPNRYTTGSVSVGDLNEDGFDDIAIGSAWDEDLVTYIWIVLGGP
jgi:hypothetical protein